MELTADDKQWINLHAYNKPKFNSLRGVTFTLEQVEEIRQILEKEHKKNGWGFWAESGKEYVGKCGQKAFPKLYPQFTDKTADFVADNFDFELTGLKEKLELKVNSGKFNYQDDFEISVTAAQYDHHDYEIIIFGWFNLTILRFVVLGWQYREILDELKFIRKAGSEIIKNGKKIHTVLKDLYCWHSDALREMQELLERAK